MYLLIFYYGSIYIFRQPEYVSLDIVKMAWHDDGLFSFIRYTPINDPSLISRILLLGLPIVLWSSTKESSQYKKWWYFMLSVGTVVGIALTFTRATTIIAFVILLYYILKRASGKLKPEKGKMRDLLLLLVISVLSMSYFVDNYTLERYNDIKPGHIKENIRYRLFHSAMSSFIDHPIIGTGPGSVKDQIFKYGGRDVYVNKKITGHNVFYNIFVETGLVGFIVFSLLIVLLIFKMSGLSFIENSELSSFEFVLKSTVISLLLLFLFVPLLSENWLWYFVGLMTAISKFSDNNIVKNNRELY